MDEWHFRVVMWGLQLLHGGGGGVSRFNLLHLSGALSRRWPDCTILHLIAVFSGPFTTSQEANCNIFEHGGEGVGVAIPVAASASQDSGGPQRTVRGKRGGRIHCCPQACFTFRCWLSDHSQLNFALPPLLFSHRVPGTSRFRGGERRSGGKSHGRIRQRRRQRPNGPSSAGEIVGTRPRALLLPRRTGDPDTGARRLWVPSRKEKPSFFSLSRNLFALVSPLHWFTYFTALWLNGPSGAKVK